MEFYTTIDQPAQAEFKDRGSKFIAFAYPAASADEFKKQLQLLKKDHPKAVHYCFAYRFGLDGNQFRVSDDGEPAGTAGKPILGQIDSKGLTDIVVVIVRYFGGTLLGVPGLIVAYKTATLDALSRADIITKHIEAVYDITTDYQQFHEVMNYLKREAVTVLGQQMNDRCMIQVSIHPDSGEKLTLDMETKFGIIVNFKYHA